MAKRRVSKHGKRASKKRASKKHSRKGGSKRRSHKRRFGAFGSGSPNSLLEMSGPYL
jgi:hypothetical protein